MRIGNKLYLDHHATTPVDPRVSAAMTPYFTDSPGNPHSQDHAVGWEAAKAVEEARAQVASLVGADSDEIVFTSGATEANNLALLGLARGAYETERRRVLISPIEHKCIHSIVDVLRDEYDFTIQYIPVDGFGNVLFADLLSLMSDDVLLVSIAAVNNEIGTIQDLDSIYSVVRQYGAFFHTDCAQAPCAIDLDCLLYCCDMASISAHKMYGPKGIGALYVRREIVEKLEPIIYGGGQQGLRSGTVPVPLCVGFGRASELVHGDEAESERERIRRLRDRFVADLLSLPFPIHVNGATGTSIHPGNANVLFAGFSAEDLLARLQPGLAASTGSACATGIPESSHVLRAIGLSAQEAQSSIRFGLGRYTTDDDVNEAVDAIRGALRAAQNM